ncbi:MAG TPA: Asp-tRNA(Asn)/Glu-tRNA(Gln) amidotransferase subunit GatC [Alphaproteobacteria bacterium]|jgi:aspartyl-tRNA(Asn)/glutamyl-tRNA(Gln) amidotransferase subunit C|nr:Asp-tRNA(Asn)/Glu-tRNA(Gln) amidotransferase subunit GatC [Alphaproteobacteria bacterium]
MSLDKATVARIARLARIKVPAGEEDALAADLSRILAFVEQLNELDCTDVPPMTSSEAMKLRRRADEVTDGGIPEKVLANAPEARDGYFTVPKVVE